MQFMTTSLKRRERERGQALVEFALVAPLFFLLIFGVIQFGVLFGGQIGLGNAAREVARYTSTLPPNQPPLTVKNQAIAVMRRSIPAYNGSGNPSVAYCYYANPTSPVTYSWKVIVAITYSHTLFIPLVGAFVDRIDGTSDNRFTTTVREEMRVETQPMKSAPTGTDCSTITIIGANP
jgi:Flp pilus assembly protein TadG